MFFFFYFYWLPIRSLYICIYKYIYDRSEKSNRICQLAMSGQNMYMIVLTIVIKCIDRRQIYNHFYLNNLKKMVGQMCCGNNTCNHLTVCKQMINIK